MLIDVILQDVLNQMRVLALSFFICIAFYSNIGCAGLVQRSFFYPVKQNSDQVEISKAHLDALLREVYRAGFDDGERCEFGDWNSYNFEKQNWERLKAQIHIELYGKKQ